MNTCKTGHVAGLALGTLCALLCAQSLFMWSPKASAADELTHMVIKWIETIDIEIAKGRQQMGLAGEDPAEVWQQKLQPFIYPVATASIDRNKTAEVKATLEFLELIVDEKIPREFRNGEVPDHPDLTEARNRVLAFKSEVKAFLARPAGTQPEFVDKVIIDYPIDDVAKLKGQKDYVAEATALLEEFSTVKFKDGKPSELRNLERKVTERVEAFPKVYEDSVALAVKNVEQQLKNQDSAFDMNKDWRTDSSKNPVPQNEEVIAKLKESVALVGELLPADDVRMGSLQQHLAAIIKENNDRRTALLERTLLGPDKFKGKEAAGIKAAAKSAVLKKQSGAQILRVTIPNSAWKTESVIESTDTTHTALQYRFTKWVSVHVAAKAGGEVFKHTVYVGMDKIGGATGQLKGHVMFTDRMLEKNLNRTGT